MPYKRHIEIDSLTANYICTVSGVSNIYSLDIEEINVYLKEMNDYIDDDVKDLERLTVPEFVRTLEKDIA